MGADCGHYVVHVEGEEQHHAIPDDSAPHAPTSECGCGPQRVDARQVIYLHVAQTTQEDSCSPSQR